MSRQFRVYLLPPDAEGLIQRLKSQVDLSVIQPYSPGLFPVSAESPIQHGPSHYLGKDAVWVDCYLAPAKDPEIKMRFIPIRSHWNVDIESEVIEFRGCEYSGNVLVQGRFYFQNDLLSHGMIIPKRTEFLTWADIVFRIAKKSLRWSKSLDAYVGEEAEKWRKGGGRLAVMVTPTRGPIYATEEP
jgi:hypothetical protein